MAYSVLIVDDSMPMRSVIKKTFKAAGYGSMSFIEAEDGQKALEQLSDNWVDMVLTDYNMPVMNGLELVKEMKKDDRFDQVPVVVITTEGSKEKMDEFYQFGASGYLQKPFAPEQLRDIIVELLGEIDYEEVAEDEGDDLDF
mgnify:CR=1 FL=1